MKKTLSVRMLYYSTLWVFICFLATNHENLYGQTVPLASVSDTTFSLVGDVLFTNKDFKLFIGQELRSGRGSGTNGWYNSISFKSTLNWINLLVQPTDSEENPNYQLDQVKTFLSPGEVLIVKKIERNGNKRSGYWYTAILQGQDSKIKFRMRVLESLASKEVLIP